MNLGLDLSFLDAELAVLIFFALVQFFALILLLIIRYHFRIFSLPNDRKAVRIVRVFTIGTIVLFLASGAMLLAI